MPALPALIQADLAATGEVLRARLDSPVELIRTITQGLVQAGGKRMRPALLLLCARLFSGPDSQSQERLQKQLLLAAVLELIHTATLLHDDVIDESKQRRGRPTANAAFGNAASVLTGDFLYSRSFQMMAEAKSLAVMDIMAEATNVIAEGEILQLLCLGNADTQLPQYLRVIYSKTAKLFEAGARIGVLLAGGGEAALREAAAYGRAIGMAFQMVDDCLDYESSGAVLGKPPFNDLHEGKPTLPFLLALESADESERVTLRAALEQGASKGGASDETVLAIVRSQGALERARQVAREQSEAATRSAQALITMARAQNGGQAEMEKALLEFPSLLLARDH